MPIVRQPSSGRAKRKHVFAVQGLKCFHDFLTNGVCGFSILIGDEGNYFVDAANSVAKRPDINGREKILTCWIASPTVQAGLPGRLLCRDQSIDLLAALRPFQVLTHIASSTRVNGNPVETVMA